MKKKKVVTSSSPQSGPNQEAKRLVQNRQELNMASKFPKN